MKLINSKCQRHVKIRKVMLEDHAKLKKAWLSSLQGLNPSHQFIDALVGFHQNQYTITQSMFKQHFFDLAKVFINYAYELPIFCKLSVDDQVYGIRLRISCFCALFMNPFQRRLLNRNSLIFIQFVIKLSFNAQNGKQQVERWFLDTQNIAEPSLRYVPFYRYNECVPLIQSHPVFKDYLDLLHQLDDLEYAIALFDHFE